jgi:hypothetical protein
MYRGRPQKETQIKTTGGKDTLVLLLALSSPIKIPCLQQRGVAIIFLDVASRETDGANEKGKNKKEGKDWSVGTFTNAS